MALPTDGIRCGTCPPSSDRAFDNWFAKRQRAGKLGSDADLPFLGFGALWREAFCLYLGAVSPMQASEERRTRHLGIDIFAPAGTEVLATRRWHGVVHSVTYNADPLDYGTHADPAA